MDQLERRLLAANKSIEARDRVIQQLKSENATLERRVFALTKSLEARDKVIQQLRPLKGGRKSRRCY